jgi:hypothetical protein
VEQFPDSFALAEGPQAGVALLITRLPEFAHLAHARIVCIFSERQLFLHGGPCAAFITTGTHTMGPCRHLVDWLLAGFVAPVLNQEDADFLILIDRPLWDGLDAERRERLLYHELCHVHAKEDEFGSPKVGNDGRIQLKLVPHDAEVFNAELERYGPVVCDFDQTLAAAVEGHRRRRPRAVDAA